MPKYQNAKPSILGFSDKTKDKDGNVVWTDRTAGPGEIFEIADKSAIPKHYFENGWFVEYKDTGTQTPEQRSAYADAPLSLDPKWEGPAPTQGSGTSVNQSTTDADAAKSGTYNRGPEGNRDNPHTDVKGTSGGTNPVSDTSSHDEKRKK